MNYFNRIGYIEIEDESGEMRSYCTGNSLDFKFSGEKVGNVYTTFEVGILGLSAETINQLTVWNPAESYTRKRKIAVYAGYEDGSSLNPLFSGVIIEAMPTNPPEMWMNFKCINLFGGGNEVSIVEYSKQEKIKNVFAYIADELNTPYEWRVESIDPDTLVDFDFSGVKQNLTERFQDQFGVSVYYDNDVLVAAEKRPWLRNSKNTSVYNVSTETGMLAIGNVSLVGATIRKRLDDNCALFDTISLTSIIIPKANGLYSVIKKKHVGHFRGDDWYTELECIRIGANV